MKPSMITKLANLSERLDEIDRLMSSEGITDNMDNYRKLTREHAEITPIVEQYRAFEQTEADINEAQTMLNDPEMKAFAQEEIEAGKAKLEAIEAALQTLLLPKDPNDDKNIFLEIRAGTGGDESGLFAGDLYRMYSRYAERQGWKVEVMSANEGEMGGYKEIIAKIEGYGAYSKLKFESGGHRVQRVPDTETQGRIHTSACTVAILPEADEVSDVVINPADVRIDTFRASGAGGQHINKTDSAVRLTHAPTGIVVECQEGRSQHANKAQAFAVLAARIKAKQVDEQQSKIASERKSLIGSGDRSERIRTYNYPQGRITDHRINLTLYKIDAITEGDMDELIGALAAEHQADLLASLGEDN
ncbi:peptide chain release factor 1 [Methylotenera mobilis]|uniref:Peptide chain release factor 1 n=1 Tax=Methylotenera mobilis (strain JLW8 / ATCC BAA-1282 / DSM 17540) TaxID=583345 RepID=C6WT81_METML|nr:peptide chain release factor 1 [Methylotenera mobilis]ACT49143.1 peptide chain release factor 1 [Methylotenera mobilis JLW8]